MNWEKIQRRYSNAYQEFISWRVNLQNQIFPEINFQTRDLYDFFDQNGIHLFVSLADNGSVFKQGDATSKRKFIIWSDKTFETRVEAEYKAFEKGFELLEKKLKESSAISGVKSV